MATDSVTLRVTIERASGLKDADFFGKQDPYIILRLGSEVRKTRVAHNGGTSPVFNQTFEFIDVPPGVDTLELIVREHDTFSADDDLGTCRIGLAHLRARGGGHGRVSAPVTLPGSRTRRTKGTVTVAVELTPTPQHMQQQQQVAAGGVATGYPAQAQAVGHPVQGYAHNPAYPPLHPQQQHPGAYAGASAYSSPAAFTIAAAPPWSQPSPVSSPLSADALGPPPPGYPTMAPTGGAGTSGGHGNGYSAPPPQYYQHAHGQQQTLGHRPGRPSALGMGLAGGLGAGLLGGLILDGIF
ncbi:hypothetical protein FOA52_012596 [Chlamydomonas sp. UWO 241]|nr:hypothetical protein FOA52_012596 [Chlamydomonas sp. UWO 241]